MGASLAGPLMLLYLNNMIDTYQPDMCNIIPFACDGTLLWGGLCTESDTLGCTRGARFPYNIDPIYLHDLFDIEYVCVYTCNVGEGLTRYDTVLGGIMSNVNASRIVFDPWSIKHFLPSIMSL